MDQENLGYQKKENAFVALSDPNRAQELMHPQIRANWQNLLDPIAHRLNPAHQQMFGPFCTSYYGSVFQSEWATDILFKRPQALAQIYPQLIQQGMTTFSSPDGMRFLGKKVPSHGNVHRGFQGEVVSDMKDRPEGVRIQHRMGKNSIKLYDKQGSILRAECTLNNAQSFKTYRKPEGKPNSTPRWLPIRKGIADIKRRAEISHKVTVRYLEAHAAIQTDQTLGQLSDPFCQPVMFNGYRVRGLNPFRKDDLALIRVISDGGFCIQGLRNKDLRIRLFGDTNDQVVNRRRSSMITRKLRRLRAHGLIRKVPRSHRYMVTTKGRTALVALLAARHASSKKRTELAA